MAQFLSQPAKSTGEAGAQCRGHIFNIKGFHVKGKIPSALPAKRATTHLISLVPGNDDQGMLAGFF